jgi:ketosteroid isomerase-like protein
MAYSGLRVVSGLPFLKERLSQLYVARSQGKADVFAAGFAEDGVFTLIGDTRLIPQAGPRHGRAAIASVIRDLYRTYQYVDAMVIDMMVDLNAAVVRRHLTLKSAATGAVGEFEVADFIVLKDGEIIELTQFMDTASLALLTGRI